MSRYVPEIRERMERGHPLLYDDDADVLFTLARRGTSYVEVGTYCGGSAIVAGLAGCEVFGIDTWQYPDDMKTFRPTPDDVRANWAAFGLDPEKLHLYQQAHPPLPGEIAGRTFDTGFIDGAHDVESAWRDWASLEGRVRGYMLFHDANRAGPYWAMLKALKEDPNWGRVALPIGCTTTIRALKRVTD